MTVIELLMVIAIIGMLVSLLIPAIQAAREAASRTACKNNLRQIGVAVLGFESTAGQFPGNGWGFRWIGDPDRGIGANQPGGWIYQILPHLEQPHLRTLGRGAPPQQKRKALGELTLVWLDVFQCPTRSRSDGPAQDMIWAPFNAEFHAFANRTDYAVCEGDTFVGGDEGPPTLEVGDDPNYRWTDTSRATGICFLRSRVALAEVRDGLGNTYLAGEKYRTLDDNEDPGYDQSLFSGVDLDINRWTYEPPTPDATDLHHVRFRGATRFGSSHPAAVNYVFCDGSVRSASFDIDPEVHRRLGTRAEMAFADPSALQ